MYLVNESYIATLLPIATKLSLRYVTTVIPTLVYDALTVCY